MVVRDRGGEMYSENIPGSILTQNIIFWKIMCKNKCAKVLTLQR